MFIENRDLLDESRPQMNPAVDWVRFARAVLGRVGHLVSSDFDAPGGSTLATQIESSATPATASPTAAARSCARWPPPACAPTRTATETLPARRRLLLDYLNTVPLLGGARAWRVNGLGDGLWVWFAADFDAANRLLAAPRPAARTGCPGPRAAPGGGADDRPPPAVVLPRRGGRDRFG